MKSGTEYLRAVDIARLTGMSLRTVRRWIKDELLPSAKVGGARLVALADLKAALSPPYTLLMSQLATTKDTTGKSDI
jgi:excisionase family DNA binding protein